MGVPSSFWKQTNRASSMPLRCDGVPRPAVGKTALRIFIGMSSALWRQVEAAGGNGELVAGLRP